MMTTQTQTPATQNDNAILKEFVPTPAQERTMKLNNALVTKVSHDAEAFKMAYDHIKVTTIKALEKLLGRKVNPKPQAHEDKPATYHLIAGTTVYVKLATLTAILKGMKKQPEIIRRIKDKGFARVPRAAVKLMNCFGVSRGEADDKTFIEASQYACETTRQAERLATYWSAWEANKTDNPNEYRLVNDFLKEQAGKA